MSTDEPEPKMELAFSAGRFEESVLTLVLAIQLTAVVMGGVTFAFWLLAAPSDTGDWYLWLVAAAVSLVLFGYLLKYLYRTE